MENPGRFNRKITFKKQNNDGTYIEICEAWANIKTLSANQFIQAKAVNIDYTNEFQIRYRDLNNATHIYFNNRYFSIITKINVDEKNLVLRILANEVV